MVDIPAPDNAHEFTVSELSRKLKRSIEEEFGNVRLRGEISGFKTPASGHAYFTLKDEDACIDAVIWRGSRTRLDFRPEDGLEVVATGRLTTYPGRSKYQIVVERMSVAGEGALMALYEKRRKTLAAEGLFDEGRKRALPYVPGTIGIVTSPTGAAIRDMLHRLADRYPRDALVWPVRVQGEGAAAEIVAAVRGFNEGGPFARPDLLIVARGGGSIEDLWAFNEEAVVRAVAASEIPVISAVGHETDTTLCDFAADRRAPTPTAAAEIAVPVRAELAALVADLGMRLARASRAAGDARAERVRMTGARLPSPAGLLQVRQQRFDELAERLPRGLASVRAYWHSEWARTAAALRPALLGRFLVAKSEAVEGLAARAARGARQSLTDAARAAASLTPRLSPAPLVRLVRQRSGELGAYARLLGSLGPMAPLARGYALVERAADGALIKSAAAARAAEALRLTFAGEERVNVHVERAAPGRSRKPPKSSGLARERQGKLL